MPIIFCFVERYPIFKRERKFSLFSGGRARAASFPHRFRRFVYTCQDYTAAMAKGQVTVLSGRLPGASDVRKEGPIMFFLYIKEGPQSELNRGFKEGEENLT